MEKGYQLQQWEFIEQLGAGGMAEVWKARHVHLDDFAAIKFLLPEYAANADVQARFLSEGRSQFRLRHSNIVKTSDFITQDNRHFLVMEYIEGQSLEDVVLDGALPVERALELAVPILDALGHAHENGIVHRDVKPSNILLDENGNPHLTDFGIAKALRDPSGHVRSKTATSMLMGSVHYMSPEQIQKPSEVDERSDIYSFGCVLYEMLTGQPPFDSAGTGGETDFEIQRQHVFEAARPLRKLNPSVAAHVEAAVMCALQKEKNSRFSSCQAMAAALQVGMAERVSPVDAFPGPRPEPDVPPRPAARVTPRKKTIAEPPAGPEPQHDKTVFGGPSRVAPVRDSKRQWLTAAVLVLLVGALGFAGFRLVEYYRGDDKTSEKTESTNPSDEPDPSSTETEDQEQSQEAELDRKRQEQQAALERERQDQQAELERRKRELEEAARRERDRQAAELQRQRQVADQDAQRKAQELERQRLELEAKQAELQRQQRIADQQRQADLLRQQQEEAERQRQAQTTKNTPPPGPRVDVPPRGTFRWQLNLRRGETALIRFRTDGGLEYISPGSRFVGGAPLYGVQAEVRLSNDASRRFEVSQPLLPSTGFRQIELRCKTGRCNETVEIIWTRN